MEVIRVLSQNRIDDWWKAFVMPMHHILCILMGFTLIEDEA